MDDGAGKGTLPANARRIPIPAAALGEWLADIADAVELKVTLRTLALLAAEPRRGSIPPSIGLDDLIDDRFLSAGLALAPNDGDSVENAVRRGLAAALRRRTLVAARVGGTFSVLLNDVTSRSYLEHPGVTELEADALRGDIVPANIGRPDPEPQARPARANIFALYEQHIGSYGHSIAEQLRAAEEQYPAEWIADAISIAAERNARSWNYVQAVLRGWMQSGRPSRGQSITDRTREFSHEHGKPGDDTAPDSLEEYPYLESYRRRHGRLPWESSGSE